jgi:hypothetical protein
MLRASWIATFPGIAISLTVLGYNFLGDALRDNHGCKAGLIDESTRIYDEYMNIKL